MAISVDFASHVILVPQSDLTPLGGSRYGLDVDWLRLQLKDFEDSEEGIAMPDTHRHNTTVTLSGVVYARVVEILDPYTVEFENGSYAVVCSGANHNLADRKVVNSVSLIIGNSAGLIAVSTSGSTGPTAAEIAAEVMAALLATTIPVDVQKMNAADVIGDGSESDPWRGVGVSP